MKLKPVAVGAAAYLLITFPLAVVWHVVLFKSMYEQFGYFRGEPGFALGFISILIQGLLLSYFYGLVSVRGSSTVKGLKYSFIMGAFYWTCHVLSFAAKKSGSNTVVFYAMESVYLALQFGIYGMIIGKVYQWFSGGKTST